jgi:hypothetical protein
MLFHFFKLYLISRIREVRRRSMRRKYRQGGVGSGVCRRQGWGIRDSFRCCAVAPPMGSLQYSGHWRYIYIVTRPYKSNNAHDKRERNRRNETNSDNTCAAYKTTQPLCLHTWACITHHASRITHHMYHT